MYLNQQAVYGQLMKLKQRWYFVHLRWPAGKAADVKR